MMKKIWALAVAFLPLTAVAQNTLTPEEKLEQAERQLTEARRQLEIARQNVAKAKEGAGQETSRPAGSGAATPKAGRDTDAPYLRPGSIPLVDGKVVWSE